MPIHPISEDVIEEPAKEVSHAPLELPPIPPPTEPFRGVESFRFCDQIIFSERLDEAFRLQKMVFIYRGMLLAGGSGVGKSSLVNAGFLPKILQEGFLPERVRVRPKPGAEFGAERIPLGEADQPPYLPSRFIASSLGEDSLAVSAEQFTGIVSAPHPAGAGLLVFDQFEELITLFDETPDSPEKYEAAQIAQASIIRTLARLLQDQVLPVKFLFVFREDYYLKLGKFFDRVRGLREQGMYLEPLPSTKLKHLIRDPFVLAAKAGKAFERPIEDPLADEIAKAITTYSDSPYVNLTEVQIICQTLWRDPDGAANFTAAVDKVQQIQTLLERYIDDRIARLSEQLRQPAIAILIRLITTSDTRNIVAEPDLIERLEQEDGIPPEVSINALNELVSKSRLVNRQTRGDTTFYDIVSEFLIPWIRRRRDARRDRLREEQQRAAERQELEEFLARQEMRRKVGLRTVVASVAISAAVLITAILLWWHTHQTNSLQNKHAVMANAQALGASANQYLSEKTPMLRPGERSRSKSTDTEDTHPPYPAMLAGIDGVASCLRAGIVAPPETVDAMRRAANKFEQDQYATRRLASAESESTNSLSTEKSDFIPIFPSPDGKFMVTIEHENTPVLWDAWTFKAKRMSAVSDGISAVAFSTNSTQLGVASLRGTAWYWDISPDWRRWILDIFKRRQKPTLAKDKLPKALKIDPGKKEDYKGRDGLWEDYTEITTKWFLDAVRLIYRPYESRERESFPTLNLQSERPRFTDEVSTAYAKAEKDIDGAKEQLAKTLRAFHVAQSDPGAILAEMYVSSARRKVLKSALHEAAADYDRAHALNPTSGFINRAAALRKVEEGNSYAANKQFEKAVESYKAAVSLDQSLPELVPGVSKSAKELAEEGSVNNVAEMKQLLDQANREALLGHRDEARKLYEQAKGKAPDVLKQLDPDTEVEKLAPKGPPQDNSPPVPTAASPPTG